MRSTVSYDFNMVKGESFTHPLKLVSGEHWYIYKSFYDM